jgi:hypothetical protein
LIVDPNRVLSYAIRSKSLKAIARRQAKIGQHPSLIQKTQLSKCSVLDVRRQFSASPSRPDQFRFEVGEALNHDEL